MFHILVVEDDRELNQAVCLYLMQNGYEAVGSLGANEAYDAMYGNLFDLIISDIMMPQVDGYEFAETVRSLNEEIPILFMTARDDFASKQRGFRAGIDDYMVKPIDLDELLLRIGALMRRAKIASSKKNHSWKSDTGRRRTHSCCSRRRNSHDCTRIQFTLQIAVISPKNLYPFTAHG